MSAGHFGAHEAQVEIAAVAQIKSHRLLQQNGSLAQTAAQQVASLQCVPGCGVQQSAASEPPQVRTQSSFAFCTQSLSHWVLQQNGSAAQTVVQHSGVLQFGVACATRQSPFAGLSQLGQSVIARSTQNASHWLLQQNGSAAQTVVQHSGLSQNGVGCAE